MPTVLVTGAAGFVGRHLIAALRRDYPELRVLGLDRDVSIPDCDRAIVCDLAQDRVFQTVHALEPIDYVVHLAAQSYVHFSMARPDTYVRDNVLATSNLVQALAAHPSLRRFVLVSSCEVYGNTQGLATESSPLIPRTPYAATKLAQEYIALSAIEHQKLPAVVCRLFNNYGPGQQGNRLLPRAMQALIRDARFELVGTGDQTRDWTAVEDTCDALLAVLFAQAIQPRDIFNITSEQVYSVRQILELCETAANRSLLVQQLNKDTGHLEQSAGSSAKLRSATGWSNKRELRTYIDTAFGALRES